jgi:choline dehydrogenase-like flavoprotein
MIKDFNQFDDGAIVQADVCVIGAGAAGITFAKEFLGSNHTILILESGGFEADLDTHKLYESEIVGLPHAGVHTGRARVFGGTTTLWGGQALRFDASDLRKRDWIPYSGWPLSLDDLNPYYDRAERVLKLGKPIAYEELCTRFGIEPPTFDPGKLYMECSRWSPRPDFGKTYRDELNNAGNISILLRANVTSVVTNRAATIVDHIDFQTLSGRTGEARARVFVICCGGIETARLLLASDGIERCGVGNSHDLVGRYFQEHVHMRFGELIPTDRAHLQNLYESFFVGGLKYAPKISLSEHLRQEKQLLNVHGEVAFEHDADSGMAAMKRVFRAVRGGSSIAETLHLLGKAVADPDELFSLAYRFYVKKRSGSPRRGPVFIGAQSEMAPDRNSRVLLSDARDQLGMRRTRVDWRVGELEHRTTLECLRALVIEFERLGLGSFDHKQLIALQNPEDWMLLVRDSAHHMGTTRMHESPEFGVVDAHCKVHGISNLYIGSSAVFPTSARSNPTLTILALTIRMADRLKQLFSSSQI